MQGGTLTLHSGSEAESRRFIDIEDEIETYRVRHLGGSAGNESVEVEFLSSVTNITYTERFSGVSKIVANGGLLDDTFDFTGVKSFVEVDGGQGDDVLMAGNGGSRLIGGVGNDRLIGGAGADTLLGGKGNDELRGNGGNDNLESGEGMDMLFGGAGNDSIDSGEGNDIIEGGDGNDTVVAGMGNDVIEGQGGDDTIDAGPGEDTINAGSGNDIVHAGPGKDNVHGNEGNDTITGGSSKDTLFGDAGNDTINGDAGVDIIDGGTGDDTLFGDGGNDLIFGRAGNDTIHGNDGIDNIEGNDGDDQLFGDDGDDMIWGGAQFLAVGTGDDEIEGGAGPDRLFGQDGNDTISGQTEDDIIEGGTGDDTLSGGPGDDEVYGEEGNDIVRGDEGSDRLFGDKGDVTGGGKTIKTQSPSVGGDDQIFGGPGIDFILGGPGHDTLQGEGEDDVILGDNGTILRNSPANNLFTSDATQGGMDTLSGGEGNDILLGGSSSDTITGDEGDDILVGDNGSVTRTSADVVTRIATTVPDTGGMDTLSGNDGGDIILGGVQGDEIHGNGEDDILLGDNGSVDVNSAANNIASSDPFNSGSDTITGDSGDDIILGGSSGDTLSGEAGMDILIGDNGQITRDGSHTITRIETTVSGTGGNDTLQGDEGNDILLGGAEEDTVNGHEGDDVLLGDNGFVLRNSASNDVESTDFNDGADDVLAGQAGLDILIGGSNDDQLTGHAGEDYLLGDHGRVTRDSADVIKKVETLAAAVGGKDILTGNEDKDVLLGGTDEDVLTGNEGLDVLLGDHGSVVRNSVSNDITSTDFGVGGNDLLFGNGGDDILVGDAANDELTGHEGHDVLLGDHALIVRTSSDALQSIATAGLGMGGNDILIGNAGQDYLFGGYLDDNLTGGDDNDVLLGDDGLALRNQANNDIQSTGSEQGGVDTITGGLGDDIIIGGSGNNDLNGLGGDTITGNEGIDFLAGDNVTITRTAIDVVLRVVSTLTEHGGDDSIDEGAGSEEGDFIIGGTGDDGIDGGPGDDVDVILGDNGIIVRNDGTTEANDIRTSNPEDGGTDNITGGPGADVILGGSGGADTQGVGGDIIFGNTGDDFLLGDNGYVTRDEFDVVNRIESEHPTLGGFPESGGDDRIDFLTGSEGFDIIFGGFGDDVIHGGLIDTSRDIILGDSGVTERVAGVFGLPITASTHLDLGGNDIIDGGLGDDLLYGGAADDLLIGRDGDEYIYGDTGSDIIWGGLELIVAEEFRLDAGETLADEFENPPGFDVAEADVATGYTPPLITPRAVLTLSLEGTVTDGMDILRGGEGNDWIFGGGDVDDIDGDGGSDYVDGGAGNDIVTGGGGDDVVRGGANDDSVRGDYGFGSDPLGDFMGEEGIDQLYGDTGRDRLFADDGSQGIRGDEVGLGLLTNGQLSGNADFALRIDGGMVEAVTVTPDGTNTSLDDLMADIQASLAAAGLEGSVTLRKVGVRKLALVLPEAHSTIEILATNAVTQNELGLTDSLTQETIQRGQRLFGGDGIDFLYAFAPTTDPEVEATKTGDELHGGSGGDWLYGGLRQDTLVGGNGNDFLAGDWLSGPLYPESTTAAVDGADDLLLGGSGEDQLLGGGGNDLIWGGSDSDWLEGQNGNDTLYGGAGIDILVLDVSDDYDEFGDGIDGHFGNAFEGDVLDDNATDILLIEATDFDDTIQLMEEVAILGDAEVPESGLSVTADFSLSLNGLPAVPFSVTVTGGGLNQLVQNINVQIDAHPALMGQVMAIRRGTELAFVTNGQGRTATLVMTGLNADSLDLGFSEGQEGMEQLRVDITNGFGTSIIVGTWRELSTGRPLVEQFRVSGLGGDDTISFVEGINAVDVSALTDRSNDWVGVLDGGPGDDTLRGTGGRDRLDGGFGSDTIFGLGGDDRLWGDGGPGQGLPDDVDRLFAGQGNDDVIGGQGLNFLYVWSQDPDIGGINNAAVTELRFEDGLSGEVTDFTLGNDTVELLALADAPLDGVLTSDAHFTLLFADGTPVNVVVEADATNGVNGQSINVSIDDLVDDINDALTAAGLENRVVAGRNQLVGSGLDGNLITLTTLGTLIQITSLPAGDAASVDLHFAQGQTSANQASIVASADAPTNGQLVTGDATFTIRSNTGLPASVVVAQADTVDNQDLDDLVADINASLVVAGIGDEIVAGLQGNLLTLSSTNTSLQFVSQFGVFVDPENGVLHPNDGGGLYELEDTGLNRVLGGPNNDSLYGGTGLDFLYGAGGDNTLIRADGTDFDSLDGGLAGNEWKDYARESDKVWYYRGTGVDDIITVDFVTEPGLLSNQHLITRLTDNNGNFSFDAQVKLSFNATDDNGDLIWDPKDSVANVEALRAQAEAGDGDAPSGSPQIEQDLVDGLLPPEGDYLAIIIDALGGNDMITVGPTVQKTVWIDAGEGNDRVEILSGNAILADQTEIGTRNDQPESAYSVGRSMLVAGTAVSDFTLGLTEGNSGSFQLTKNNESESIQLSLSFDGANGTGGNTTINDLIDDLNAALTAAGVSEELVVFSVADKLVFSPTTLGGVNALEINQTLTDTTTVVALGFVDGDSVGSAVLLAAADAPTNGQVTSDIAFTLSLNGGAPVLISVPSDETDGNSGEAANTSIDDLVEDLNTALSQVGLDLSVLAGRQGDRIKLTTVSGGSTASLKLHADASNAALTELHFTDDELATVETFIVQNVTFNNLTMDHPDDVDWYIFRLAVAPQAGSKISLSSGSEVDGLQLALFTLDGETKLGDLVPDLLNPDQPDLGGSSNNSQATAYELEDVGDLSRVLGLSIHEASDTDWYSFTLENDGSASDKISLLKITATDALEFTLYDAEGTLIFTGDTTEENFVKLELVGLAQGTYFVEVATTSGTATYELFPNISEQSHGTLDLSGRSSGELSLAALQVDTPYLLRVTTPNFIPTIYDLDFELNPGEDPLVFDMATRTDTVRKDVILGGPGDDILSGGAGEDWIFGGFGNDVLSGGLDRQAPDLLFGESGDDTFQLVPDGLPFIKGSDQTFIPTFVDNFFGGDGEDRVLFLGGDEDANGQPVPDHVAIRYNRFLHRYEFTSLVWDTANQLFVEQTVLGSVIIAPEATVPSGILQGEAVFTLDLGDGPLTITLSDASTVSNTSVEDLILDIEEALKVADDAGSPRDISDLLVVSQLNGRLTLATTFLAGPATLTFGFNSSNLPASRLGFTDGQNSGAQKEVFTQEFIFYQVNGVEKTVIDTQAGDDIVRGDPEYKFPNTDSEWGIDPGDFEQRGLISALEIHGGDGNDSLFGGALDDSLFGGAGIDFIAGGGGNDFIDGGAGADLLAGDSTPELDTLELVTRNANSGRNDEVSFASLLPLVGPGSEIDNLTFHEGDSGDWFAIPTPNAANAFHENHAAHLTADMINVVFDEPDKQAVFDDALYADTRLFLFAARDADPNPEVLELIPVEQFAGVPEYYLLHVLNVQSFWLTGVKEAPEQGDLAANADFTFKIGNDDPVAVQVIDDDNNATVLDLIADINAALVTANLDDRVVATQFISATGPRVRFSTTLPATLEINFDPVASPAAVSLGLENGQTNAGQAPTMGQYKLVFSDGSGSNPAVDGSIDLPTEGANKVLVSDDLAFRPTVIPVGDLNNDGKDDFIAAVKDDLNDQGDTLARLYFGGDTDTTIDASDVTLQFPAPLLGSSTASTSQAFVGEPGDVNGDGIDDLIVSITLNDPDATAPAELDQGVFILFGRTNWNLEIDVAKGADVFIEPPNAAQVGTVKADSVGDLDNDNFDDLVISESDHANGDAKAYLFYGRSDWQSSGVFLDEDFGAVSVNLVDDGSVLAVGQETVAYDADTKVLTIKIISGASKATDVIAALNSDGRFTAVLDATEVSNNGTGLVDSSAPDVVTSGGDSLSSATASMNLTGGDNDLLFTATVNGAAFNNVTVSYVDDGSITDGTALAVYDNIVPKTLVITIQDGATTAQEVVDAVNEEGTFVAMLNPDVANDGAGTITAFSTTVEGVPATGVVAPAGGQNDITLTQQNATFQPSTGLWHLTHRRDSNGGHSGNGSLYFGDEVAGNYVGTGGQQTGRLTSNNITLADVDNLTLTFSYFLHTEGLPASFDQARVLINDGTETLVASNATTLLDPTGNWQSISVDLDAYRGETVTIIFEFDSIDGAVNNFEGWYVDDVLVAAQFTFDERNAEFQRGPRPTTDNPFRPEE